MTLKEFLQKAEEAGIGPDDQLPSVQWSAWSGGYGCCCGDCCNSGFELDYEGDIESVDKKVIRLDCATEI
jgi:hypothetical protein